MPAARHQHAQRQTFLQQIVRALPDVSRRTARTVFDNRLDLIYLVKPTPKASTPAKTMAADSGTTSPTTDPLKYPIPVRWNLGIVGAQLASCGLVFYATSLAAHWWQLIGLAIIFAILGNSIYSIIHEAEHGILHPNRKLNDAIGVGMALLFPASFHLIRQGHIGHHRRNRSDDEAFDLYYDGDRPWLKYLILYGILTGFYWMLVVLSNAIVAVAPAVLSRRFFEFDRPSVAFMESLNPKHMQSIQLEGLAACGLHVAIIWLMDIPLLSYAVVYFGFGLTWSAMQYVHHFGTERHVLRGSRNLWLFGPIDWIWLHHNWHREHHLQPTVPWIYLPELAENPEDRQRDFLMWHYLKMWRGPRKAEQRVENKFAGKIIQ